MGAEGHGPFDDGGYSFVIFEVLKPITKLVNKKRIESYEFGEVRAAAEIIILISKSDFAEYIFNPELLEKTIKWLDFVSLTDYSSEWEDSLFIKKDIKRQIRKLNKLLDMINSNEMYHII